MFDIGTIFPYSDFHKLNLDWILKLCKKLSEDWDETRSDWEQTRDFITNYFKNLDLQEEVNKKLEEMYDSGELQNIISSVGFLPRYFDTFIDAETQLDNGMFFYTGGYYALNDGGNSWYYTQNTEPENKAFIKINDIYVVPVYSFWVNAKSMGAHGDGTADDTTILNALFSKYPVFIPAGRYMATNLISGDFPIIGEGDSDGRAQTVIYIDTFTLNYDTQSIKNISFYGKNSENPSGSFIVAKPICKIKNCNFLYLDTAIDIKDNCWLTKILNCRVEHSNTGIKTSNNDNFTEIKDCYIHLNKIGVEVGGTTINGGSPQIVINSCDIEDNTKYGIMIRDSKNNSLVISDSYFETHYGWHIYTAVFTTGGGFVDRLSVTNTRFYCGEGSTGVIYLANIKTSLFSGCTFADYDTSKENLMNKNSETVNVVFVGCKFPDNIKYIFTLGDPDTVIVQGATTSLPKIASKGSIYIAGDVFSIDAAMKFFDGQYWRSANGDIYTE